VWNAEIPTNWTVEAKEEMTVCKMRNAKNPEEIGGLGKYNTMSVATRARMRRGKNAYIHGLRGLSPLDHFAANHPPRIWKGKSISTTSARSSRLKPFSTNFNDVAASFAQLAYIPDGLVNGLNAHLRIVMMLFILFLKERQPDGHAIGYNAPEPQIASQCDMGDVPFRSESFAVEC